LINIFFYPPGNISLNLKNPWRLGSFAREENIYFSPFDKLSTGRDLPANGVALRPQRKKKYFSVIPETILFFGA